MGKLTLMLVLAAALGGALLTFSTRGLVGAAEADRRGAQAEVLARDLAQSVHAVVTGTMLGPDGFRALRDLGLPTVNTARGLVATVDYAGGVADVDYTPSGDRQALEFQVTAFQEGAVHRVRARYAFDDVDFPTPLWLDVPYVTASIAPGATVSGGAPGRQAVFDRSKYDELGMQGFAPPVGVMAGAVSSLLNVATGSTNELLVRNRTQLAQMPGMEDINVANAEGLYFAAVDAMRASDVNLGATSVISNNRSWGSASAPVIVRAPAGLTIASGGRVRGTGALVVEGPLTVAIGGTLDWDGLVIVHSEQNYLPIRLQGSVTLDGALVVDQQGAPPGGHMDVSVWRAPTGSWPANWGDLTGSPFCGRDGNVGYLCRWWEHTHRFDRTPEANPRGQTIQFLDRDVAEAQLRRALNDLGSRRVMLELVNHQTYSGMARYAMEVDGQPDEVGVVRLGFEQADGSRGARSRPFRANDLDAFTLEVRSLRMLRPLFDGTGGCASWPVCVGERRSDRHRALTVRVRDASTSATYYEAAVYWHMQQAEVAEHQAAEEEWRRLIASGLEFGTRLEAGASVRLRFDAGMIRLLAPRLGFDQPEADLLSMDTQHWEVGQPGAPTLSRLPDSGRVAVCHSGQTLLLPIAEARPHVNHGDPLSTCPLASSPTGPGGGSGGGSGTPGRPTMGFPGG